MGDDPPWAQGKSIALRHPFRVPAPGSLPPQPSSFRGCRSGVGDAGEFVVGELLPQGLLENLPTDVLGTSSMNTTSSGIHHLATRPSRKARISSLGRLSAVPQDNAGQRTLGPLGVRHGDHGCFGHRRMGHDLVFEPRPSPIHSPPVLMTFLVRSTSFR